MGGQNILYLLPNTNGRMEGDERIRGRFIALIYPDDTAELTYTENVSAHGAGVVSRRPWHRGELAQVTSFGEQIRLRAKVIHRRKFSADRYAVGLTVQGHEVTWLTFRSSATS